MDLVERNMLRRLLVTLLLIPALAAGEPWFQGDPEYTDEASRQLAAELLDAHGGMAAIGDATSMQFNFFTKMIGNPTPFYSFETLDLATGDAYVEWPFWNATIAWNQERLWTRNWPMPLPAGFFVRLTSSFLTLPWQIQTAGASLGPVSQEQLPGDETLYDVLRVRFNSRHPGIPGTYYDIFVHPEDRLMTGIRFDINHPGMVANPKQPLGPNYHVFGDYRKFNGMVIPTFYKSYGQGSSNGGDSNAYHFVWNMQLDQALDSSQVAIPDDAEIDEVSTNWWLSNDDAAQHGGSK
jgi:hypothetical protein